MANITSIINGGTGSAQHKVGTTIQTFAISLAAGFILFGVQFGAFIIVRNYLWSKRIYQPRAFLVPLKSRVKPPPNNPLKWILTVFKTPEDPEILQKAGIDAYFFMRFLAMCLKIFFPMAVIILPILIPLNFSGGKDTKTIGNNHYNITGLDTLAWSNVSPKHTSRYWAHLILGLGVVVWVCYIFHLELMHYILKRQEFLSSPSHRLKASSTTVLITDIPKELCNFDAIMGLYGDFPGGVRRIWINRDLKSLVDKVILQHQLRALLETAETDLIRKAIKAHRTLKKGQNRDVAKQEVQTGDGEVAIELLPSERMSEYSPDNLLPQQPVCVKLGVGEYHTKPIDCESDLQYDLNSKAAWTKYLQSKQRPTMNIPKSKHTAASRIPLLRFLFTRKVDTVYHCRRELSRLNKEVELEIEKSESYPQNGSAFIQFNSQKAAHLACQSVADIFPRQMTQRLIELSPADINWSNLGLSWRSRHIRLVLFNLIFLVLLFVFGIVSFFTGILSRLSSLSNSTSWLHWVGSLPPWLLSFIQGTLPPVIQVILLSGPLPIILRALTNNVGGAVTASEGERSLQLWYFIFLVIELFIIPTISSGLTSIVENILNNPFGTSIPNILATNMPTAANYYFSFLVVQALSISASSILQTVRLFNYYVLGGAKTPHSVFDKLSWTNMTRIGSNIPWYTTFAVIGLVYSVIAPLILVFMVLTFGLFWIVIKNNLLYVVRTGNVDGGGLFFPKAINQLFFGLYCMEVCLIGLFFLAEDIQGNVACKAQGIIMSVTLLVTACYHMWLNSDLNVLYKYAPVRLQGVGLALNKDYENESSSDPLASGTDRGEGDQRSRSAFGNSDPNNADTDRVLGRDYGKSRSLSPHPLSKIPTNSRRVEEQQRRDRQSAKEILARINRPLDEARLLALENRLIRAEVRGGNRLVPRQKDIERQMMDDPISKIIMQHNDELEDLDAEDRDMLTSVAFTHPILREPSPSVWIPSDDLGVSDDEVKRTVDLFRNVSMSNKGAFLNKHLKVRVKKPPPDMSEFALVMAEL